MDKAAIRVGVHKLAFEMDAVLHDKSLDVQGKWDKLNALWGSLSREGRVAMRELLIWRVVR